MPTWRGPTPRAPVLMLGLILAVLGAGPGRGGEPGVHSTPLEVSTNRPAGFTLLPPAQTGLWFTNVLPEWRHLTNQILLNGAGVAAADVDGDGWCDLYLCRSHGTNALYRNLGGWRFAALPQAGGAGLPFHTSTGATFADLDGDGDMDLVVNTLGRGTHLFFNDGRGSFAPASAVLNPGHGGMSMALADTDGDGWLDLYVGNYRTQGLMDIPNARATFRREGDRQVVDTLNGRSTAEPDLAGRFIVDAQGGVREMGEADVFYRNVEGKGFEVVPFDGGRFLDEEGRPLREPPRDWALTVFFRDFNADSRPDLYVCNDFHTEDRLWLQQPDGRFRLAPWFVLRRTPLFSMAVDMADINADGFLDFLVLDMMSREHGQRMRYVAEGPTDATWVRGMTRRPQYGHNMLYLNRGDHTYAEIAQLAGLEAAEWAWSCAFLDVDLDGLDDVLVVNGMERAARDADVVAQLKEMRAARRMSDAEIFQARRMFPRLTTPNLAFRNRGNLTFEEMGKAWHFDTPVVSSALALADLDNDGDLDVVVNNLNAGLGVYRNDSPAPRAAVRLRGRAPNTQAIGARLQATGGAVPVQLREITAGGRYLGGDDTLRTFAAGPSNGRLRLTVTWRSGVTTEVDVAPNHRIEITEPDPPTGTQVAPVAQGSTNDLWFEDCTARLGHVHVDPPYDDFVRQPLLPNALSHQGPGVAWLDWDGDGWDDLMIGTGSGGRMGLFRNDARGGFEDVTQASGNSLCPLDIVGLAAWARPGGHPVALGAAAVYEQPAAESGGVWEWDVRNGVARQWLPPAAESWGPLALADVEGDGDLDLFVGGRVVPGRYPEAAASRVYRWETDRFVPDTANTERLRGAGLVTAAVWTDLDADGDPDLVLATEWGAPALWRNEGGQLSNQTDVAGLGRFTGWWTSVAAADFNGDGKLDLALGNWGRNTKYEAHRTQPLELRFADFDGDGSVEIVEAHFDAGLGKVVPERQFHVLNRVMPFIRERFETYRSFSRAGLDEVLGDRAGASSSLQATCLESMVFLNRGTTFEPRPLPAEAQFAPVFGLGVADVDGDGCEDLLLAQNFFSPNLDTSRYDAGRGLWLRGDGQGGFQPVDGARSGLLVYGEGRGCAVADFDRDGRVDVAMAQNAADTRLFRNRRARPGLILQLRGQAANPLAIGAQARLRFGARWGPVREWHAGTGYGSQDSLATVLATPEPPTALWVRWPGGAVSETPVPPGARTLAVDAPTPSIPKSTTP